MPDHSKEELRSFNPTDPQHRRKLWVRIVTPDSAWYHVFWRRVALAFFVLIVAGWLSAAAAAWSFVAIKRGYTGADYFDFVLFPWRKEHYRAGLGHHFIARGREELAKKNFREGYAYLVAGLVHVPDDIAARRLLATTQIRFDRSDLALKTLAAGTRFATADLDYLKLLFGLLLEAQEDERVIALAQTLLPPQPDSLLRNQFIALEAATAHYNRGRYDEAEKIAAAWRLGDSLEGQLVLARCDWERGYPDLAFARLQREIARFSRRDELYLQLIRFHREAGHNAEARRYALLRQFNEPTSPGPRIDLLHTYRTSDDTTAADRELKLFWQAFGSDPQALMLLAWFAVDTAQPALAQQLFERAKEKKFPLSGFRLANAQAAMAAQDYAGALQLVETALREENPDYVRVTSFLNGLRAVALFGTKDRSRADLLLGTFLNQARLRSGDALLLARQLRLLNEPAQARRVFDRAYALDPLNESALAELVRADSEAGNRADLAENLPKLLRMRKPPRAVLEETLLRLDQPGDAALRESIRAALKTAPAIHSVEP